MNKEKIQSVIRALIQIVGLLIALNVGGDYVPVIGDVLAYLVDKLDAIFSAANELIGIAVALYGFFKDNERFDDRVVGSQIKADASMKGMTVSQYLKRA